MKIFLSFCVFLSVCSSVAVSQHLNRIDTNKYRINLPDYWKPGNKIWQILSDKLPLVCEEIRDKELCGDDCNPRYTIEFEMSKPVVFEYRPVHILSAYSNNLNTRPTETWDIQTIYGFECSLLLRNETGQYIKRFIIVDMNETWRISNRVTLNSYASPPAILLYGRRIIPGRRGIIDPVVNPANQQILPATAQEGETPYAYILKNREKLAPAFRDMFDVIDQKICSW
ncbi:MAG: hypothetical protein HZB42_06315 [Sphingobacteriales bacterium]|nr:hypothetical protein [Sphingobacteriales bacterium]